MSKGVSRFKFNALQNGPGAPAWTRTPILKDATNARRHRPSNLPDPSATSPARTHLPF